MNTEVVKIVVAAMVPIVTAVLGVLGIVFQDWRVRRTQAGRRKLALEEASKQTSFAAEWWNARRLLADSPEAMRDVAPRALAWLEEASALVIESRSLLGEKPPITIRRLLLFYPLRRRAAKILRGGFYLILGLLINDVGFMITDALKASERQDLGADVVYLVVMALLALGLRFYAGFAEKSRSEHGARRQITVRRLLLLYPLHRRAANIVRIIFYLWIAGVLLSAVAPGFAVWKDPYFLPAEVATLIVVIGYAIGLQYWAASLGTTREAQEAGSAPSSPLAHHESQS